MKYYVCNWLGVISPKSYTEDEVLKDLESPIWPKMGWFYMPQTHVHYDGIRHIYDSCGHEIRSIEDFNYYKDCVSKSIYW